MTTRTTPSRAASRKPAPNEPPPVRVGPARGKGRGMFATRRIRKGEIIERAPVIPLNKREWGLVQKTILSEYCFEWGPKFNDAAIVLGYGMLYNHSYTPNARFDIDLRRKAFDFIALRDIARGEEVCTNYNGVIDDTTPLWFHEEAERKRKRAAKARSASKKKVAGAAKR